MKTETVEVEGEGYEVLFEFQILWHRWELDSLGWVVNKDGARALVLTSHGDPYFPGGDLLEKNPYFTGSSFLVEKIAEYEKYADQAREALRLLEDK